MFNPEQDGWRLSEAVMRLSDPEALATLAHYCSVATEKDGRPRLPPWWLEECSPAAACPALDGSDLDRHIWTRRFAIERAIADRLTSGEIVGWARRDSPMAPYECVPADAWPHLGAASPRYWDWRLGTIRVVETHYHEASPPMSRAGLRRASKEGPSPRARGGQASPLRARKRVLVPRLYSARIQPPDSFRRSGTIRDEKQCRAWLIELMKAHPESPTPKALLMQEATQRFRISKEAFKRAWSGALRETGSTWDKPGRRKSDG
jgi:hypothetical protein